MPLKQLLTPLPFTQVQVHDAFWAPRMRAHRSATLPAEYAQLESTGRLAALELAWQPGAAIRRTSFGTQILPSGSKPPLTRLPRSLMRSWTRSSMQSLRA